MMDNINDEKYAYEVISTHKLINPNDVRSDSSIVITLMISNNKTYLR